MSKIYLTQEVQGKFLGRLLYEKNCSELRKKSHITRLTLDVWDRNMTARKFYKKMGFTKGEIKQYHSASKHPFFDINYVRSKNKGDEQLQSYQLL